MNKHKLFAACVALGLLSVSPVANADRSAEIGGFVGAHIFNDDSELGVTDAVNADSLENSFAFGIRAAYALVGQLDLEAELAIITPTTSRVSDVDVVALGWRAHALFHILDGKFRPFVLAGAGGMTASPEDDTRFLADTDFVMHAGIGAKYDIQDSWGVRLDARLLFPPSSASEFVTVDGEIFLGLYKTFGIDSKEEAPVETQEGDRDGDGVLDSADACPDEAAATADGCPEAVVEDGVKDADNDGVSDDVDKCINEAEDKDGFQDEDGCPDNDNDNDGIADANDECANEAEDKDGFEDDNGCPDPDNDKDGVLDANDKCPAELETQNGYQDSDGCADTVPAAIQKFSGAIEGIRFKTNSAKIRSSSNRVLNKAVKVLKQFTDVSLEIQGHTDASGDPAKNLALSQSRAEAVVAYFVKKGIAADRLTAKGFGPDVPVADNSTKKGMEKNRRVEFKLISK